MNSTCDLFFSNYDQSTKAKSIVLPYSDVWINYGNTTISNTNSASNIDRIDIDYSSFLPFSTTLFNGQPYTLSNNSVPISINLFSNNAMIDLLEDDEYIEIGIPESSFNLQSETSLFTVSDDGNKATVDLKHYDTEYDSEHFTTSAGFVYFGINSSSVHFTSDYSISDNLINLHLPRPTNELETSSFTFINTESIDCNRVDIDLTPGTSFLQDYFQGNPYTIENANMFLNVSLYNGGTPITVLPTDQYFLLQLPLENSINSNSVLFDAQLSANSASIYYTEESDTSDRSKRFDVDDNIVSIPFTRSSSRFLADLSPQQTNCTFPLLVPDTKLTTNGVSCFTILPSDVTNQYAGNLFLDLETASSIPIEANDMFNQYSMSLTSSAYRISLRDGSSNDLNELLEDIDPALEFESDTTANNLIFFDLDSRNRFYSYPLGVDLDGYHFTLDNDQALITCHNAGYYFSTYDSSPHQTITKSLTNTSSDVNLSLYQHQFMLPAYYLPFYFSVGDDIQLSEVETITGYNPISAVRLDFLDNANQQITTNFIFDYINDDNPLLYVAFPSEFSDSSLHFYFRDFQGVTTELNSVSEFGDEFYNEFIIYGNSCITVVNESGYFFVTE